MARMLTWVTLLAVMAPMGCSMYRPPTITVGEATVAQRSDEAVRLDVVLDLANADEEALELLEFTYSFTVAGRAVYHGRRAAEATLSGGGGKRLLLPAVVRFDRMGWDPAAVPREVSWSVRGSLLYITPGEIAEILLDTGVRKPRVSFSGRGVADLGAGGSSP